MKVASFAPLPPARTGVADYAATLTHALCAHGEVVLGDKATRADIALYHIGNNHLHRDIYRLALSRPGVAVLHDATLNHFFLGTLDRESYVAEFVYNYGEWNQGLADSLWRERARSAADPRYFEYPMLKRLACASRAIICHNPAAARIVREHHPTADIFEIAHFFDRPTLPDAVDTLRFRHRLGLGPGTLLAGVFGHLRESKRLPAILRAVDRVRDSGTEVKLLVQGSFASPDLQRSLSHQLQNQPHILRTGFLEAGHFWKWAAATDVCINLRYPSAAETSGIAVGMMGIGKAVIFSDGEEIARIPENACLRVDRGPGEEEQVADYLCWLAADREALAEIGRRAAAHIGREHALEKIAAEYWRVLERTARVSADSRD